MRLHASFFSCRCWVWGWNARTWNGRMKYSLLSPIFGPRWCWSLPWAAPRMSPPKDRLPLRKFNLLCKWMFILHTWWGSFCSHYCEPNITGRFLSCTQNITPITRPSEIWTVVNAVTQNRHFQTFTTKFTQSGAHCPVLFAWPCRCGVRANQPGGGHSLLPCRNTGLT